MSVIVDHLDAGRQRTIEGTQRGREIGQVDSPSAIGGQEREPFQLETDTG